MLALFSVASALVLPQGAPFRVASSLRPVGVRACAEAEAVDPWTTTSTGLKYQDIKVGDGPAPASDDTVTVHYTGVVADSRKEFDTSIGRAPFAFKLGQGRVIPGWEEGIASMRVGGTRKLLIPSELAYGEAGAGAIPPNSDIEFECELLTIEQGVGAVMKTIPGGLPNVVLASILLLSFVPYFLPEEIRPAMWK